LAAICSKIWLLYGYMIFGLYSINRPILTILTIQEPTIMEKIKKRFNLQAPPVYDRKVTNLFFFP
jgi:hypothetical protein